MHYLIIFDLISLRLREALIINERGYMSFLKDALKSNELSISLDNISTDDNKDIKDYTLQEVLSEARYVLSCFYENGHVNNDWLNSDIKEDRKDALKEVRVLKQFIKKWGF